jgi:hypothetical protein
LGCSPTFLDPGFDFGQVPGHATWRQIESSWEFTALFQLINSRISKGNDLAKVRSPDCANRSNYGHLDTFALQLIQAGARWGIEGIDNWLSYHWLMITPVHTVHRQLSCTSFLPLSRL